ncbi:MAG TPA: CHASE2 domain-containing protein, partial [Rhizomicrobium sp.]
MNFQGRPIAIWAFPGIVLAAMLFLLASDAGGVATQLRGLLFDSYQRSLPRPYQDTLRPAGFSVRTLEADAASLKRFGPWPWPHAVLARLTRALKAQGAAMAVFAFPLDTPDAASPRNLLAQVPAGPEGDAVRRALTQMTSPDDGLAAALSQLASVTGFTLGSGAVARAPEIRANLRFSGTKNPFGHAPNFATAQGAIAAVERTSLGIGALNLQFDADGELRRMPLAFRLDGAAVPSLTAEVLRVLQNKRHLIVRSNEGDNGLFGARPGIASVEARNADVPLAPDGSLWLAFAAADAPRGLSAAALDEGRLPHVRLANAVVILGPP